MLRLDCGRARTEGLLETGTGQRFSDVCRGFRQCREVHENTGTQPPHLTTDSALVKPRLHFSQQVSASQPSSPARPVTIRDPGPTATYSPPRGVVQSVKWSILPAVITIAGHTGSVEPNDEATMFCGVAFDGLSRDFTHCGQSCDRLFS